MDRTLSSGEIPAFVALIWKKMGDFKGSAWVLGRRDTRKGHKARSGEFEAGGEEEQARD